MVAERLSQPISLKSDYHLNGNVYHFSRTCLNKRLLLPQCDSFDQYHSANWKLDFARANLLGYDRNMDFYTLGYLATDSLTPFIKI